MFNAFEVWYFIAIYAQPSLKWHTIHASYNNIISAMINVLVYVKTFENYQSINDRYNTALNGKKIRRSNPLLKKVFDNQFYKYMHEKYTSNVALSFVSVSLHFLNFLFLFFFWGGVIFFGLIIDMTIIL